MKPRSLTLASALAVTLGLGSAAQASPRRQGLAGGVAVGGGTFSSEGETGPSVIFRLHLGWLFAEAARIGVGAELAGGQAWLAQRRLEGAVLASVWWWPSERVSLTLGGGFAASDADTAGEELVGGGPAVSASLGVDVIHWRRRALVARAVAVGGEYDQGSGAAIGITIGVELFEIASSR